MDQFIPFSSIFVKIGGIPKILVKLPIKETRQLSVKIWCDLKNDEKANEISHHYGQIKGCEKLKLVTVLHCFDYWHPFTGKNHLNGH